MAVKLCLCLCLYLCLCSVLHSSAADSATKHENDAGHTVSTGAWSQDKPQRLFARARYLSAQRVHGLRPKPNPAGAASAPVRRCAGLMESCSGRTPCCEPCSFCHCRLFNTICHCWRLGACPKKT